MVAFKNGKNGDMNRVNIFLRKSVGFVLNEGAFKVTLKILKWEAAFQHGKNVVCLQGSANFVCSKLNLSFNMF